MKKVSPRIFLHFAPCLAEFTKDEEQKRAKLLKLKFEDVSSPNLVASYTP